ncbi:MAG: DNA translocase FtsK 4TM domain-containing protein [Alphaproteobacteria bacterium]
MQQQHIKFLPDGVREGGVKFANQFAGIALLVATVAYGVMMLSHHPQDPSFNMVTDQAPVNLIRTFGSHGSDLIYQMIGLAGIAPFLMGLGWAWRLMTTSGIKRTGLRLFSGVVSLGLIAILLGLIESAFPSLEFYRPFGLLNYGGMIGYGITGLSWDLQMLIAQFNPDFVLFSYIGLETIIIVLLIVGMAVISLYFLQLAIALRASEWQAIGGYLRAMLAYILYALRLVIPVLRRNTAQIRNRFARPDTDMTPTDGDALNKDGATAQREIVQKAAPNLLRPAQADTDALENPPHERAAIEGTGRINPRKDIDDPSAKKGSLARQTKLNFETEEYELPGLELLNLPPPRPSLGADFEASLEQNARQLELVLQDFSVKGTIIEVSPGPVVTLYAFQPAPGIKSSRVIGLADDVARSMSALSVRIATVPGRNVIGIEMPNHLREMVSFYELLESASYRKSKAILPLILGKDIAGAPQIMDLSTMPHLLIAGTTGSGKSVGLNGMILSLLYRHRPDQCRFIMIDPKMLELSVYNDIPHLLTPVVTDPKKAVVALKWCVREMENRYSSISRLGGVRNIDAYNKKLKSMQATGEPIIRKIATGVDPETGQPIFEEQQLDLSPLPYIVVVVDEMADLMLVAGKEIEASIQRLAQMARAAGIHIIMATQRPSVDVITGTIKANFPTRISFMVTSKIDARTVMGEQGAEQLLGKGDMLVKGSGGRVSRVHGPFVEDSEVEAVCNYIRTQGTPNYLTNITDENDTEGGFETDVSGASNLDFLKPDHGEGDGNLESIDLYDQAVAFASTQKFCSISRIQRQFRIGYNRAADIVDRMESEGVISSPNHAGKREVLVQDHSSNRAE